MNYFLDSATVKLTCLTPVHIGSDHKYNQAEYVISRDEKSIILLNELQWLIFLKKRNLIEAYKVDILNKDFNLTDWVRKHNITDKDIMSMANHRIQMGYDQRNGKNRLNDIAATSYLSNGVPYIPGSSLKGAIRTLLLNHLLQKNNIRQDAEILHQVKTLKESQLKRKGDLKRIKSNNIENVLLCDNDLYSTDNKKNNMTKSIMRGIRVSDGQVVGPVVTQLFQKHDASYSHKTHMVANTSLPIWRECLPAGTEVTFTLTIDKNFLKKVEIEYVDDLLDILKKQTQKVLQLEDDNLDIKDFRRGIEADACLLLGGGIGFISKTILYSLFDTSGDAARITNEILNANFKKRNKRLSMNQKLAPETFKVVQISPGKYVEMGLCKLEVE